MMKFEFLAACRGRPFAVPCGAMNDLLAQAKAELARWQKIVELLQAAPSTPAASSTKPKGKGNPASREYWTAERRAKMSKKLKAVAARRKKAAPSKAQPAK